MPQPQDANREEYTVLAPCRVRVIRRDGEWYIKIDDLKQQVSLYLRQNNITHGVIKND